MKINIEELDKRVDEKLLSKQRHPEFPIWIYNYTEVCQFSRAWDEYTSMCRGLIVEADGTIIARPFEKFFNLEELEGLGLKVPQEYFTVSEKFDGSLGISYCYGGEWFLATRGSFVSDQARVGTEMFRKILFLRKPSLNPKHTYLFEIIYPENRIVVNYGDMKELVLLNIKDTDSGRDLNMEWLGSIFRMPKIIDVDDLSKIKELAAPNSEGFVVRFLNGFRVKVKFDEYVRLHRIMTGVNSRRVWEVLRAGDGLDEYLQGVPEEFTKWILGERSKLLQAYESIESRAAAAFDNLRAIETRKDYALAVLDLHKDISGILFKMKDEQDYSDLIWKMIKPESTAPFKVEI